MTAARFAWRALLVTLVGVSGPVLAAPNPGGNGAEASKRVSAVACRASVCRLTVKVDGECGISVEPEWLFVSGKNVRLVWEILPAGYHFHPTEGVRFKDEYNPAWRSEFFEVGKGEGDGPFLATDARQSGPARQSVWGDVNRQPGVFRYSITVVNSRTLEECRVDPGVVNDWD